MVNKMNDKKKALLIGNYKDIKLSPDVPAAPYHPLELVEKKMIEILGSDYDVMSTDDTKLLVFNSLDRYDILISYADFWDHKLTQEEVSGIISFVSSGKGLLVIHSGISYQSNYEFAQMVGAKFTGHPDARMIEFRITSEEHPVMTGVDVFSLHEEPYQFEFDAFLEKTVLFDYVIDGKNIPAGWAVQFGKGRVVYLMPGHSVDVFENETYARIIKNSAAWLL